MTSDKITDHASACRYIERSAALGSRPGLSRIRRLCEILGDPQDELKFIHIAGTNGKGSTAAMISSILTEAGLCTGMYTSPALTGITDHFRLNKEPVSDSDYDRCVSTVAAANEKLIEETGESATQFELETAIAFVCFRENHCDAVVLECVMGGRDDATNIVRDKICCVFASVSFDHMQYLGNTLSEIADVKSGIITSNCPVIAFDSAPDVVEVFRARCKETGSTLHVVKRSEIDSSPDFPFGQNITYKEFVNVPISLCGTFQAENAALALETVKVIRDNGLIPGFNPDDDKIITGIGRAHWDYRFWCIKKEPVVIVDGAHNEDAATKLCASVKQYLAGYDIILVIGVFADKEYDRIAAIMAPLATTVFTVETPDNPRALPAGELAKCVEKYCGKVHACSSVREACELSLEEALTSKNRSAIVACGSLSYLKLFCDGITGSDKD